MIEDNDLESSGSSEDKQIILSNTDAVFDRLDFNGDQIEVAVRDHKVWVSLRRICESMGIDFSSQRKKLLDSHWASVVVFTTELISGKKRNVFMIDRKTFWMWISSIHPKKIAQEFRGKLMSYQCEFADVIDRYMDGEVVSRNFSTITTTPVPARLDEENMLLNRRKVGLQLMGDFVKQGLISQTQFLEQWSGCSSLFFGTTEEVKFEDQELYVQDFLLSKGLKEKEIKSRGPHFGKLAKQRFMESYGEAPEIKKRPQPDGTFRPVNKYTEKDRPLFEAVFLTMFGHDKALMAKQAPKQLEAK